VGVMGFNERFFHTPPLQKGEPWFQIRFMKVPIFVLTRINPLTPTLSPRLGGEGWGEGERSVNTISRRLISERFSPWTMRPTQRRYSAFTFCKA